MVLARIAGSSARGMPALTSSMWAPASTWASDVALDAAEVAGLHLLGQELAAGRVDPLADDDERRSQPMTTSRVAEPTTVTSARHVRSPLRRPWRESRPCRASRRGRAEGPDRRRRRRGWISSREAVLGRTRPRAGRPRRLTSASRSSPQPRAGPCATPRCSRCRRACRPGWRPCRWRPGSAGGGRPCSPGARPWPTTWAGMSRHQMTVSVAMGQAASCDRVVDGRSQLAVARSGDARTRGRGGRPRPARGRSSSGSSVWARKTSRR